MKLTLTPIKDLVVIEPKVFGDAKFTKTIM